MKKNLFSKIGSLLLVAALTAGMLSVAGIPSIKAKADASTENFTADFSGLKDGVISTEDQDTVKYLDDRFLFYAYQYYSDGSGDKNTQYFERKNVNGYLIDDGDNGQKFPDTGAHAYYDMDGYGTNADKPIPMWTVDGKWLYSTSYSSADAPLFRTAEMLYLKGDTLTEFAVLEDFKLETDFMFKEDGVKDNLAILFRGKSAGSMLYDVDRSVITFDADGNLYVGNTTWGSNLAYDDTLKAEDGSNVTFVRGHEYHLSMVVKGSALTFTVTDGDATVAAYTKNGIKVSEGKQGGYLALSGSNGGVKYANISAERYGRDGSTLDFNDLTEGYGFGMNARAYNCCRTNYLTKEGDLRWEDNFNRNPEAEYEFDFNARHGEGEHIYWLGAEDAGTRAAATELGAKFNVYHDQNVNGEHKFAKATEFYTYAHQVVDGAYPGAMMIANGNRLLTRMDVTGQDLLKQNMSLVPKTNDGNEVVTENFETRFSALLFNNGPKQTVSLSFRSKAAGRSINDDVTGGYADKVTVHFNGAGYAIFDGESSSLSEISYTPWNDGKTADGATNIYVKAVGDKLWMQVTTDSGDVLFDNSDSPITLNTSGSGYLYYTANDMWAYFTSIACGRLDEYGHAADWNTGAVEHKLSKTDAKAATCESDGNIEYYTCSVCNKLFKDANGTQEIEQKDTIVPAGHKLTKVEAKAATCESDGSIEYYTCSACGKLFKDANGTQEIEQKDTVAAKLGHKLSRVEAKAATCDSDGNIEHYTCSVCGKLFADENGTQEIEQKDIVIAKLGHKLTKVEAKAATVDSEGNIEYYVCSVCGKLFADAAGEKALTADEVKIAKLSNGDTDQKDNNQGNTDQKPSNGSGSPKTGDTYSYAFAAMALVAAMAALIAVVVFKKRKENT